jgi:hypothetical protein
VCLLITGLELAHADYNSSFNPIDSPMGGDVAVPGSTFPVVWEPTTTGVVSLFVHDYTKTTGNVIADSIDATLGMYNWNVPAAWAANSSNQLDPFQYEMRIYNGSLGLATYNITPFASRQYSYTDGYFAITNDDSLLGPVVSVDISGPTGPPILPTRTRTRGIAQATRSGTSTLSTAAATRVPTFLSIISAASKYGSGNFWGAVMVLLGIIIGGIIL